MMTRALAIAGAFAVAIAAGAYFLFAAGRGQEAGIGEGAAREPNVEEPSPPDQMIRLVRADGPAYLFVNVGLDQLRAPVAVIALDKDCIGNIVQ